ncbi:hypothetical protein H5410_011079 [Solanum commersonii]|uniref:Uncharacterized protein n=1 Tax=Solanum commersonii TaxID=4109 RepID=A0A9J6AMK6_SOLCO|nr:hypothetical protein H5410_011079 [Solanum commersonii]
MLFSSVPFYCSLIFFLKEIINFLRIINGLKPDLTFSSAISNSESMLFFIF